MLSWREIQKNSITSIDQLATFLDLSEEQKERLLAFSPFSLKIPYRIAQKMEKKNLEDPLFLQFVPLQKENESSSQYSCDPLQELKYQQKGKLLKKYSSRALLLTTNTCAMHCRFCFRRHFPYEKNYAGYEEELKQLKEDPLIEELILSGGDPLALSDQQLASLISSCEQISHIRRIRFHTRFPIGIPERISENFLKILSSSTKQIFFVLHVNHPRELDKDILEALHKVQRLGIPVLTQSVLLRKVNDSSAVLKELFQTLTNHGCLPYYLYLLDEVKGASHFEVSEAEAKMIHRELLAQLSGYAVPKLAKEIPGESSKSLISPF